jgi:hypothetical protein
MGEMLNFMDEPINTISLGAGVQSSTMALMAAAGEIAPMPTAAVFADTQAEPKSVYVWLDWLEKQLPFPVVRVTSGSLEDAAIRTRISKKGKLYNTTKLPVFTQSQTGKVGIIGMRNCTADFKIVPVLKESRKIGNVPRGCKEVKIIQWIGISLDEALRMKDSRVPWMQNRWPLIDARMTRADCLRWMESHRFPKPPRSACVFCPFHNTSEWRRLKTDEPEEFKRACEFEAKLQASRLQANSPTLSTMFLHRSCKPLADVDFSTEEERGQINMFNNECEGMCGV